VDDVTLIRGRSSKWIWFSSLCKDGFGESSKCCEVQDTSEPFGKIGSRELSELQLWLD
jgi:hypothetical protein